MSERVCLPLLGLRGSRFTKGNILSALKLASSSEGRLCLVREEIDQPLRFTELFRKQAKARSRAFGVIVLYWSLWVRGALEQSLAFPAMGYCVIQAPLPRSLGNLDKPMRSCVPLTYFPLVRVNSLNALEASDRSSLAPAFNSTVGSFPSCSGV